MPGPIDLHAHSSVSDGTRDSRRAGAVRPSTRVSGSSRSPTTTRPTGGPRRPRKCAGTGMTLVPGLELSTQLDYASVHVLGYLVDPAHPDLGAATGCHPRRAAATARRRWCGASSADYALTWDDVLAQTTPGATVGRPHIADALVARGHVPDRCAAFQSILHWRGGYYQPHQAPPPIDGVRLIRDGGRGAGDRASGSPRTASACSPTRGCAALVDAGLFGLEIDHRDNPPGARPHWARCSRRGSAWSRPGRATTTATGKPNRLGENTTCPRSTQRSSPRRPEAPRSSADTRALFFRSLSGSTGAETATVSSSNTAPHDLLKKESVAPGQAEAVPVLGREPPRRRRRRCGAALPSWCSGPLPSCVPGAGLA